MNAFELIHKRTGEMIREISRVAPDTGLVDFLVAVIAVAWSMVLAKAGNEGDANPRATADGLFRVPVATELVRLCTTREQAHLAVEEAWAFGQDRRRIEIEETANLEAGKASLRTSGAPS